jgi:hypothetical protein
MRDPLVDPTRESTVDIGRSGLGERQPLTLDICFVAAHHLPTIEGDALMPESIPLALAVGAVCFGLVIGWVAYRTIRRSKVAGLSDLATVIGAVGGGAVTGIFPEKSSLFGLYCIGLAVGFFGYLITAIMLAPKGESVNEWLGEPPGTRSAGGGNDDVVLPHLP